MNLAPVRFGEDDGDGDFEYLEEGVEQGKDVISTEGCFECKMTGSKVGRRRRIKIRYNLSIICHDFYWSLLSNFRTRSQNRRTKSR